MQLCGRYSSGDHHERAHISSASVAELTYVRLRAPHTSYMKDYGETSLQMTAAIQESFERRGITSKGSANTFVGHFMCTRCITQVT